MKKLILILLLFSFSYYSCCPVLTIDGEKIRGYGLLNKEEKRPDIKYRPCITNIIWGIVLIELVVPTILLYGYRLNRPSKKNQKKINNND